MIEAVLVGGPLNGTRVTVNDPPAWTLRVPVKAEGPGFGHVEYHLEIVAGFTLYRYAPVTSH